MIRFNSGKLLVVAPATSSISVPVNKQITHITQGSRLFPLINEWQPGNLLLDHDYLGPQTEQILRRIYANPFYHKIKIYCYKSRANTKVDGLLKTLGVQYFIYGEESQQVNQPKLTLCSLKDMTVALS